MYFLNKLIESNLYLIYSSILCSGAGILGTIYHNNSLKFTSVGLLAYLGIRIIIGFLRSDSKNPLLLTLWITSVYPLFVVITNNDSEQVGFIVVTLSSLLSLPIALTLFQGLSVDTNLKASRVAKIGFALFMIVIGISTSFSLFSAGKQAFDMFNFFARNFLIPLSLLQTIRSLKNPRPIQFIFLMLLSLTILGYGLWAASRTYTFLGLFFFIVDISFYPRNQANLVNLATKLGLCSLLLVLFIHNTSSFSGLGIISKSNSVKEGNNNIFNDSRSGVWMSALKEQDSDIKRLLGNGLRRYYFPDLGKRYTIEGRAFENQFRYGAIYNIILYGMLIISFANIYKISTPSITERLAKNNLLFKLVAYTTATIVFIQNDLCLSDIMIYTLAICSLNKPELVRSLLTNKSTDKLYEINLNSSNLQRS